MNEVYGKRTWTRGWPPALCLALLFAALRLPGAADAQGAVNVSITDGREVPDTGALMLFVTVTGPDGTALTGLEPSAFSVNVRPEGGAAEPVESFELRRAAEVEASDGGTAAPMAIALALDKSDSMRTMGAFEPAKQAAAEFIDSRPAEDQIALYAFDEQVVLLQDFTTDRDLLKAQLTGLTTGGGTALYEIIHAVAHAVRSRPERRAFVVLTDGHDDTTLPRSEDEAIQAARDADAPGYMLGFGNPERATLLRAAEASGGRFLERPQTDDVRNLFQDLDRLLSDQYVLTHSPSEAIAAGDYAVEVVVRAPEGEGRDTALIKLTHDRNPGGATSAPGGAEGPAGGADEEGDDGGLSLAVIAAGLVFIVALIGLGWLLLGRRQASAPVCPRCHRAMDPSWTACLFCQNADEAERARAAAVGPGAAGAVTTSAARPTGAAGAGPAPAARSAPEPRPTRRDVAPPDPTVALRRDQAWLTVIEGPRPGDRIALADDVSLGRAAGNTILLEDPTVSRHHARIRRRDSDYILHDLSQTSPTRVNGELGDGRVLQPGDRVELGRVVIEFSRGMPGL